MAAFHGHPLACLENDWLRLDYLTAAGPRLVRLFLKGHPQNLLAEVPEIGWETPAGEFRLYGGHRLWLAPETELTSYPDNTPPAIQSGPDWVRLTGAIEQPRGLQKEIEIQLHPDQAALTLTHRGRNLGKTQVRLALWAITQLPLGGTAVLPQQTAPLDPHGWQPNRSLVLWPYTDWADPRLQLGQAEIRVAGAAQAEPCKLGYFNRQGWIEYQYGDGLRLRKRFAVQAQAPHPDFGCNVEVYVRDRFIELETLGPLIELAPGEGAEHVEIWEIAG